MYEQLIDDEGVSIVHLSLKESNLKIN